MHFTFHVFTLRIRVTLPTDRPQGSLRLGMTGGGGHYSADSGHSDRQGHFDRFHVFDEDFFFIIPTSCNWSTNRSAKNPYSMPPEIRCDHQIDRSQTAK